jgi:hypothetical protein
MIGEMTFAMGAPQLTSELIQPGDCAQRGRSFVELLG